jgi:hypothetical protein
VFSVVQCDAASLPGTNPPTPTPTGNVNYLASVTYKCTKSIPKPVERKRTCRFDSKTKKYALMGDPLECPGKAVCPQVARFLSRYNSLAQPSILSSVQHKILHHDDTTTVACANQLLQSFAFTIESMR